MQYGLNLVQQQTLKLAPQLVMQMKILLLSRMELENRIQEELEVNPLLEVEPPDESGEEESPLLSYSEMGSTSQKNEEDRKELLSEPEVFDRTDPDSSENIYEESDVEWENYFDDLPDREDNFIDYSEKTSFEDYTSAGITLQEHLLEQLTETVSNPIQKIIGEFLIGNIDSSGFLKTTLLDFLLMQLEWIEISPELADVCRKVILKIEDHCKQDGTGLLRLTDEELSEEFNVDRKFVVEAREIIKKFQPYGIGSSSLKEALLVQFRSKLQNDPKAEDLPVSRLVLDIIRNYLEFDYLRNERFDHNAFQNAIHPRNYFSIISSCKRYLTENAGVYEGEIENFLDILKIIRESKKLLFYQFAVNDDFDFDLLEDLLLFVELYDKNLSAFFSVDAKDLHKWLGITRSFYLLVKEATEIISDYRLYIYSDFEKKMPHYVLKVISEYMPVYLEENGFICENKKFCGKNAVEEVLGLIQTFTPYGVGARDLRECLLIQYAMSDINDDVVYEIIHDYLDELATNKLPEIASKLNVEMDQINKAAEKIRKFEPKPGREFDSVMPDYIVPDIYVEEDESGEFVIRLNDSGIPRLTLSPSYRSFFSKGMRGKFKKEKEFIKKSLESAKWLISSIYKRQQTIFKVSSAIVEFQKEFLRKGIHFLKPMTLKDISEKTNVVESTVSRVINGKFLQAPAGIFELKSFFTSGVSTKEGGDCSRESIKDHIKKIIEEEEKAKPLSDDKIMKILNERGIEIKRRTIQKYREELGIPSSSKRKTFKN